MSVCHLSCSEWSAQRTGVVRCFFPQCPCYWGWNWEASPVLMLSQIPPIKNKGGNACLLKSKAKRRRNPSTTRLHRQETRKAKILRGSWFGSQHFLSSKNMDTEACLTLRYQLMSKVLKESNKAKDFVCEVQLTNGEFCQLVKSRQSAH